MLCTVYFCIVVFNQINIKKIPKFFTWGMSNNETGVFDQQILNGSVNSLSWFK